jgi:2'-5' RNA ligase
MRLFIGVPLAPAVIEQLAGLRKRLERPGDDLRWSSAESWHITLQFLGATTETQYACVLDHLKQLTSPSISIRLESLGFFDRAGVFFVDVSVTPQLARLQEMVTRATSPCGFVPEDRPYHPHITLARKKGQAGGIRELKRRLEVLAGSAPHFPAFTAHEFLLYESFLGPAGSRYEVRAHFPLTMS